MNLWSLETFCIACLAQTSCLPTFAVLLCICVLIDAQVLCFVVLYISYLSFMFLSHYIIIIVTFSIFQLCMFLLSTLCAIFILNKWNTNEADSSCCILIAHWLHGWERRFNNDWQHSDIGGWHLSAFEWRAPTGRFWTSEILSDDIEATSRCNE